MRPNLLIRSVVTAIGIGFAAGPVYADCPADIQTVEERLEMLSGMERQRKSGAIQAVEDLLGKAKDAWSAGKVKKCEKLAQKAIEKSNEKLN